MQITEHIAHTYFKINQYLLKSYKNTLIYPCKSMDYARIIRNVTPIIRQSVNFLHKKITLMCSVAAKLDWLVIEQEEKSMRNSSQKRVLALMLAVVITIGSIGTLPLRAQESETDVVIWQLSTYDRFTSLSPGPASSSVFPGQPARFQQAGASLAIVHGNLAVPSSNSIQVIRSADWHGIDILRAALDFEPGTLYSLTVIGRAAAGTPVNIQGHQGPWAWLTSGTTGSNGTFTLTGNINYATLDNASFANSFRVTAPGSLEDIIIDDIIVKSLGVDPGFVPPPPPRPEPEAEGDVLRVETIGAQYLEGAQVPVTELGIQAGNIYEISLDMLVPSATHVDARLIIKTDGPVDATPFATIIESDVFRSHPGFHDPSFTGPEWRRYTGTLDLSGVAVLDFDNVQIVTAGDNADQSIIFRADNFTVRRIVGDTYQLVSHFDFETGYAPFTSVGNAALSTIADEWASEWHAISFADDWAQYEEFIVAGSQMQGTRVNNFGRTDNYSYRLENVTGLWTSGDGNYLVFNLPEAIPMGARVYISWWVYVPGAENLALDPRRQGNIRGPAIVLNGSFGSPEHQPTNFRPGTGTMADLNRRTPFDTWFQTVTYTDITAHVGDVSTMHFRFRVNEPHEQPAIFFIDDIEITVIVSDEPYIPTWDAAMQLPPMQDAFMDYFTLGNILEPQLLDNDAIINFFLRNFNSVTAENAMKPGPISGGTSLTTRPYELLLDPARAMVDFAEYNDLEIIGHALIWHEQSSVWQYLCPDTLQFLTRTEAMENMRWFIQQYAGYFDGRIDIWDVTNEVVSGSTDLSAASYANVFTGEGNENHPVPQAGSWMRRIRNNVPWFNAFSHDADFEAGERGWDYIYYAYVFAHRYAPTAHLIYNDFADEAPGKRDAIAGMVEYFNKRWHRDSINNPAFGNPNHPDYGRLLIEGIGMQAHYNHNTNIPNVREAIIRYAQTGARVHVTELDIDFRGAVTVAQGGWMTPAQLAEQGSRYGQLFEWYLEFANYIDRVTFWGRDDISSWRSDAAPTLFNRHLNPKPGFFAIMDAAANHSSQPFFASGQFIQNSLRDGEAGIPYHSAIVVGGRPAPTLAITEGALPLGLSLSPSGAVSGTPQEEGMFTFTVAASSTLGTASQQISIYIGEDQASPPEAPAAPTLDANINPNPSHNTVVLTPNALHQFAIYPMLAWQDSNVFTNLTPETEFRFVQRVAATGPVPASQASAALVVSTTAIPGGAIAIHPESFTIRPGLNRGFITPSYDGDVVWTISGNSNPDTAINAGGFLTVAENESSGFITVTATSVADALVTGTAGITIANTSIIDNMVSGLNFDQYPRLRDVFSDYFLIGVCGDLGQINARASLIGYHFNAITFENSMKPQPLRGNTAANRLQPVSQWPGISGPRNTINASRNIYAGMQMTGHTLAWHSQSPEWMWDRHAGGTANRQVALENMRHHIRGTMTTFGHDLHAIDVVNEAIGSVDPTRPRDWRNSLARGEGWYPTLGAYWVAYAFIFAAEIADELEQDVVLYYNDFLLHTANKMLTAYEMVKEINQMHAEGKLIHPITGDVFMRDGGKLLIEGIGMQDRQSGVLDIDGFETAMRLFATLGVMVSITEMDLSWPGGTAVLEREIAQAQEYARLFELFRRFAAGPATAGSPDPRVLERVTFWGTDDQQSWAPGDPMIFNRPEGGQITAKEAFIAILDPLRYLEMHPWSPPEPVNIPGVYVFDVIKHGFSGMNIILGNCENSAFQPIVGATYRMEVRYQSVGTYGLEAHWIYDNSFDNFTAANRAAMPTMPRFVRGDAATGPEASQIPTRFFNPGVGGSYARLVTEFVMPENSGNIAIRGYNLGHEFNIYSARIIRINNDGTTTLLVDYPNIVMPRVPGIMVPTHAGMEGGRADIIVGRGRDVFPFADGFGPDHERYGEVAFTPEVGATYRIMFNVTSWGASGWRVRWIPGLGGEDYTTADGAAVNAYPMRQSTFGLGVPTPDIIATIPVATVVPSHPNAGVVNTAGYGIHTIVQDITFCPTQDYQGLIGNIALRGTGGSGLFGVNWISIQRLEGGPGSDAVENLNFWPYGLDQFENFQNNFAMFASDFAAPQLNVGFGANAVTANIVHEDGSPVNTANPPVGGQVLTARIQAGSSTGGGLRFGTTLGVLAGNITYTWAVNDEVVQTGSSNTLFVVNAFTGYAISVTVTSDWEHGALVSANTPLVIPGEYDEVCEDCGEYPCECDTTHPIFNWNIFNNGPGGTQYPRPNPGLAAAGTIRMWTQLDGVNTPVYFDAADTIVALDQDGQCAMHFVTVNQMWVAGTGWVDYFNMINVNKNGDWEYINLSITVFGQTVDVLLANVLFEPPAVIPRIISVAPNPAVVEQGGEVEIVVTTQGMPDGAWVDLNVAWRPGLSIVGGPRFYVVDNQATITIAADADARLGRDGFAVAARVAGDWGSVVIISSYSFVIDVQ